MLLILGCAYVCSTAQISSSTEVLKPQAAWDYLLAGWQAEREKLRSGTVTASGELVSYKDYQAKPSHKFGARRDSQKINVDLIFNYEAKRKRQNVHEKGESTLTWIARPDFFADYTFTPGTCVTLHKPGDQSPDYVFEVDPRSLGFFGYIEFLVPRIYLPTDPFHKSMEWYQNVKHDSGSLDQNKPYNPSYILKQVKEISEKVYEIHLAKEYGATNLAGRYRREIYQIDESKGFAVVKKRVYSHLLKSKAFDAEAASPDTLIDVTWERIHDVWLPVKSEETFFPGLKSCKSSYQWEGINEPVDDTQFEIDQIGAPVGACIADLRLGRENSFLAGKVGQAEELRTSTEVATNPVRTSTILLGTVVLAATIGLVLFWFYRKQGR